MIRLNTTRFAAFLIFLLATEISPSDRVILDNFAAKANIGNNISFFEDTDKKIQNLNDILSPDYQIKFKKSDSESLNFGQTNLDYWLKITIENPSSENISKYLVIDFSNINVVDFYSPNDDGSYNLESSGMNFPFETRKINNRNFVFKIDFEPGQTKTYYIRAMSGGGLILPLYLWNIDRFNEYNANAQQGLGIYYGIMIVMILYNLFIFFSVRDISYFYYVTYILGFFYMQLVLTGNGFQYIWSEYPWLQRNSYVLSSAITLSSVSIFAKRFLNTKIIVPKIDIWIKIFIVLEILLFFTPFILPTPLTIKLTLLLTFPPILLIFLAGIIAFFRKFRPARFFLLAFTSVIITGIITVLKFSNIVPSNLFTDNGLYFGSALEMILLSIALADRINIMKKEKDEAQAKTLEMQKILTESYARFVPRDFLASLGKDSILDVKLGDQIQRNMAVLFSDIRSFTTLSEHMSPEENFNFINSYLGRMSPIIQRHSGFIDKFIGDAIMALFQNNVIDAIGAGVEMQLYLSEYNAHRKTQNYPPIEIGVGIHSGSLMLGTIGSELRLEGTVISDTVNLASRIESLTKVYGSRIAVSETAILEIKKENKFHFRFLDRVKVKGKTIPVSVYEIIDGDLKADLELKLKTLGDYSEAVKLFHSKNFIDAREYFSRVAQIHPGDKATLFYQKRLQDMQ